jgi:hypothetical protein
MAVAETAWPSVRRSPRRRWEPQRGFSRASRRISSRASGARGGRPGPRRLPKAAHSRRTSARCQRSSVSGRTGKRCHSAPGQGVAQGGVEQAVAGAPARPLDRPPQPPNLVPEDEQLDLAGPRRRRPGQAHLEEQAEERVGDGQEHARSVAPIPASRERVSEPHTRLYAFVDGVLGYLTRPHGYPPSLFPGVLPWPRCAGSGACSGLLRDDVGLPSPADVC